MCEDKGREGPGGLGMLTQLLRLPPGLLGQVAATDAASGGQRSRRHPQGRPGGSLSWVISGWLSAWLGSTPVIA